MEYNNVENRLNLFIHFFIADNVEIIFFCLLKISQINLVNNKRKLKMSFISKEGKHEEKMIVIKLK